MSMGTGTSEFKLTVAVITLGKIGQGLALVLPADHIAIKLVALIGGFVIDVAGIMGYAISRGIAKIGS